MGFLGSILGTNSSFQANPADIKNPTSLDQIGNAYNQVQNNLGQQQSFANAVAAQNGLGNQSSVFGQMQGLAGQLQDQANGNGPNPALAQLSQTTGQNVANQAALMAGQRGASANAGMMARQVAQQGATTQQQSVGQAAALRAQQQLAAQQALQQQQANMAGLAGNQVSQQAGSLQGLNQFGQNNQANLLNAQGSYNNALMTGQSNANAINAGTATQNASNNASMIGGLMSSAGSAMSSMGGGKAHGGMIGYADGGDVDAVPVQSTPMGPVMQAPALIPNEWAALGQRDPSMGGGGGGGGMASLAMLALAHGGMTPGCYADGGGVLQSQVPTQVGPSSRVGRYLKGAGQALSPQPTTSPGAPISSQQQLAQGMNDFAKGLAAAFGSKPPQSAPTGAPGASDLPAAQQAPIPSPVNGLPQGGIMYASSGGPIAPALNGEAYAQSGMKVPGQAKFVGDTTKNDTVPAMLSPGEIIVPRSHASDPMLAAKFAYDTVMRNRGGK